MSLTPKERKAALAAKYFSEDRYSKWQDYENGMIPKNIPKKGSKEWVNGLWPASCVQFVRNPNGLDLTGEINELNFLITFNDIVEEFGFKDVTEYLAKMRYRKDPFKKFRKKANKCKKK